MNAAEKITRDIIRREALDTAKGFRDVRRRFSSEKEWRNHWQECLPDDDDTTFRRVNRLIAFSERVGNRQLEDLTDDELIELDRAFWSR